MSKNAGVARAAGILMVAMLVSRLLGFVREQAMTTKFGGTAATDAYIAAFTVPDLLYNLLVGGALSAAFIPVFSGYIAREEEEEGWEVASTVINLAIILLGIGIILGMIFTPYLVPLVAHQFSGETLDLTIRLSRIMFPAVLITGLNGLMMGILNSYKHFMAPAMGAVVYNLGIIVVGVFLADKLGIAAFSFGVLIGVLGNFFIQFPTLKRIGLKYRLVLNLKHPGVIRIGVLMVPALIGLAANQINLIVNQNLASGLTEGSITALRMANRLMVLPLGLFAFSIGAAIFPTLTSQAATKKYQDFKETLSLGVRSVVFITLPAAAGLMALAGPIVRLLFQQGKFTAESTLVTADALFYYSIGLFAQAAVLVLVRAFYALHDTKTPLVISVLTILANYLFNIMLINSMQVSGLALAYSISGVFNMVALMLMLRVKLKGMGAKKITRSIGQTAIASTIMALTSYYTVALLSPFLDLTHKSHQAVEVGVGVVVGVLVFALAAILMRMEEAEYVTGILKRKFGGKKQATT